MDGSPSLESLSEQDLLILCREGNKKSFGELVARYQRLVVGIAYRMTGDVMLAEDVAQDAFLRAWERLDRFTSRGEGSFRAWLCKIVTNMTLDRLRGTRPSLPLDELHLSGGDHPGEKLMDEERSSAVRKAIMQLPAASRAALVLREYEDFSYREIADALDIPLGTVMSRLNYARGKLRKSLTSYQRAGEE